MSRFLLSINATSLFTGGNAPNLEILIGGIVVSSISTISGTSSYEFALDFTGSFPSSLSFRFDSGSGDPGDSITFNDVQVNGQSLDLGSYLSTLSVTQGQSSVVDTANTDYLYGQVEPTLADLGTVTITGTSGDDFLSAVADGSVMDLQGGNDFALGQAGDDRFNGGAGDDFIFAQGGNDFGIGGTGDDTFVGGEGNDLFFGQGDNDTLIGENGNDVMNGGAGNDLLTGDAGMDVLYGGADSDTLDGGADNDFLDGGSGIDILVGNDGDDEMYGGSEDDQLFGESGADEMYGEGGADVLIGGIGADVMDGGSENDELFGGDGVDNISGGANDDQISGGDDGDVLNGDGGIDVIIGGAGADTINGGTEADILHGHGLDADEISSILFANSNVVYSQETGSFYQFVSANVNYAAAVSAAEGTTLNGLAGHLVSISSAAENSYVASLISDNSFISGADIAQDGTWQWNAGLEAGMQFSDISGTAVNNMYENWAGGQPQTNTEYNSVLYTTGDWHDWVDTSTHSYVIEWEAGLMSDDAAVDTINGGDGNDWIYGYEGNDILNGDANDDIVVGGAGGDTIDGGTGADVLYAYDATVETANALVGGGTITLIDEAFGTDTGVFSYTDGGFGGSDGTGVTVTGSRETADGGVANGSLEVFIDRTGTFTNASGTWDSSVSHTADLSNVQITFSYRHTHDTRNDTGEDSRVYFEFDGVTYDASGGNSHLSEALGSDGATDTGWITVTIDLPDITASTVYNLSLGIFHDGANRNREDALVRFDDITLTGDESAVGGPPTVNDADIGETNVINGGAGNDLIYGSAGTDTLNGDAGVDTIYSASSSDAWDAAVANVLANNAGVVYSEDTNSFYQHVTTNATWSAADTAANAATLTGLTGSGYLAAVTSQVENDFIFALAGGNRLWIGGTDASSEGTWSWASGGPEDGLEFWSGGAAGGATNGYYSNWVAGDPSNDGTTWDYTEYRADGTWWSNDESSSFDYIIEWDANTLLSGVDFTTINGGADDDILYGNDGIDIFDFDDTLSQDTIENFSVTGHDALDISDILSGYDSLTSDIRDFVSLTESGGNTTVAVDAAGTGAAYVDIADINGVTGLDLFEMIAANNLLV